MNASHSSAGEEVFEGQGLVEYALIIVLVALAVFFTVLTMGNGLYSVYSNINTSIGNVVG